MDDMFGIDFGDGGFLPGIDLTSTFDPWHSGDMQVDVIGDPSAAPDWIGQTTDFTCAVVSQQMILQQFGIDVSEAELVFDSVTNGWITDQGTSMEDAGALLEHYGIPTHVGYGGGIESLLNELAQGHKVIVGVDSGEMWGTDAPFSDWFNPEGADHAIVISGIDVADPQNIKVIVNDPGSPDGAGRIYPLDEFMEAWNDSGQYYVATDIAPKGLTGDATFAANFDADTGWYMDQDFWAQILEGIFEGVDSGITTYQVTMDPSLALWTGTGVALIETFSQVMSEMDQSQIDELLYSV
jgi:hypothetical protein